MAQFALVSTYELAEGLHRRASFSLHQALCVLLVCAGYYAGALIGQSLRFPDSHLSLIWPPTALLLAALLLVPPRRWWIFLVAVSPVHAFVQFQDAVPALGILSQLLGNFGQALVAATTVRYFAKGEIRLDSFRGVIIFTLCAVILAPFAVSAVAAYLYVLSGWEQDYWYVWRARVLSNALSTLTIIPPILMVFGVRKPKTPSRSHWRLMEFALLTAGLVVAAYYGFGEEAGVATLLCAPLPFLLWAAVRFDIGMLSVALLVTAYVAFLSTSNGQGPFATRSAEENALALQLYLITISLPLVFLATLIREWYDNHDALRESEARYRALVMAEANIIWQANAKGEGFLATPSWFELTGQSEDEVENLGWLNAVHPKDQERSERLWKQAMAERRMYENEFQVRTRDGDYRYFHVQAVPILSSGGDVGEWIGAAVDITEQKDAALAVQRHRDELAHVARISTMGELAASLAHELNQPLTAILSNAQAAQRFLAANPADVEEIRVILQEIVDDNKRASEVIRRMRELVKKGQLEVASLELADVIRDVVLLIHSDAVLHNVNIMVETAPDSPRIQGDRVQLQQVLLNLLLNAFQAMKDSAVDERQVTVRSQLANDGHTVIVAVRDRGVGLKGNQLEKMFQPFYTTKSDGLGMGLAISRSIIEAHGGRLWAENNPDRGATLYFSVPVAGEVKDHETNKSNTDRKRHSYADGRARSQA